jgi:hypothetical protein
MTKRIVLLFVCAIMAQLLCAQPTGGRTVFEMLRLPTSARALALGGTVLTVSDDDINISLGQPAAFQANQHGRLTYQHLAYYNGINGGQFGYAHHLAKKKITVAGGAQFLSYGKFTQADEFGQITGEFDVADYSAWAAGGYQLYDKMRVGARVRFAYSVIDAYRSAAITTDLAAMYIDSAKNLSFGLIIMNAGVQLFDYQQTTNSRLPFEVRAGVSKRLRHLPFRVSIHAQRLDRWNLRYDDPKTEDNFFNLETAEPKAIEVAMDNLFRHLIFSGEFLLGPRELFRIRMGYNRLQRADLSVGQYRSLSGFSGGFGLKLSKFRLDYGMSIYHFAGPVHSIGISTALSEF